MSPSQYEQYVSHLYSEKGFDTEVTSYHSDYGMDVLAEKGMERICIQVKMFGNSNRKVNRQMIMELHGSKDYFNCSKAVLVTNGSIILNAKDVAKKLGIELKHVEPNEEFCNNSKKKEKAPFDLIWEEYIFPLKGKTLERSNGKSNRIIDVNWGEVVRETSIGNKQSINIEIFKLAINKILGSGKISRKTINEEYARRASSGIVLILSQIPFFIKTENPSGLLLNETKCQEFLKNKASKIKGI